MALEWITYFLIFGKPVIFYLGIATFVSLAITAILGWLVISGKAKFNHHKTFAMITIVLAIIHGLLGLAIYL